ncbi:hypothetical protein EIL87_25495 [Saccharopolyspora rhizosphaerae]|uniref:KAP NTPase domain-containing protein n=1 Tax=Saccharopolyspora rhizosphaerae TaxID=2492662 RepID=A0A426JIJ4_9PSEU|nr:hypothetical protein [Saccharopolyspora rhizosphaerae]RRO13014.1 hypothetical protein EIL87_25495 [Saccharopolyspora rhizosphaerae]
MKRPWRRLRDEIITERGCGDHAPARLALDQSSRGGRVDAGTPRTFRGPQPPTVDTPAEDLLAANDTAEALLSLIEDSVGSTPFTVAIDAGWGKSSLMQLMRTRLEAKGTPTAWFNAWTSGADSLEVLIKSVLLSFDRNIVRRAYHRLARRRRFAAAPRIVMAVVVNFFGLRRLVDTVWDQLSNALRCTDTLRLRMRTRWSG